MSGGRVPRWKEDDPYFHRRGPTRPSSPRRRSGEATYRATQSLKDTVGFDAGGQPKAWPMRLAKRALGGGTAGLPAGEYTLRCRTIDGRNKRNRCRARSRSPVGATLNR